MTVERLLELQQLNAILSILPKELMDKEHVTDSDGNLINLKAMIDKFKELQNEFMKPYVINKASREE